MKALIELLLQYDHLNTQQIDLVTYMSLPLQSPNYWYFLVRIGMSFPIPLSVGIILSIKSFKRH